MNAFGPGMAMQPIETFPDYYQTIFPCLARVWRCSQLKLNPYTGTKVNKRLARVWRCSQLKRYNVSYEQRPSFGPGMAMQPIETAHIVSLLFVQMFGPGMAMQPIETPCSPN